jgi:hypothetical protein
MKKSQLQQIIREEIQNALNESIYQLGWNGRNEKPIKIEPTREKDGIYITNEDKPGQMWFIPSDQLSGLANYLQSLNLEKFNPDGSDSELNPGLVGMVNKLKKQKSLDEGNLLNPQATSKTDRRNKEYLNKLRVGKKGDRIKMFGSIFNKEINNFDRYSYEVTLLEPFKKDPEVKLRYWAPADYNGETILIKLNYGADDIELFKNGKMWTPHTGETSIEDFVKSLPYDIKKVRFKSER